MIKRVRSGQWAMSKLLGLILLIAGIPLVFTTGAGASSQCATVKIEIRQELTLERQAFDAHMRINNGLTHIGLEEIRVEVLFSDPEGNPVLISSDPQNSSALFFIRVDSMENIDSVDGSGTIGPATAADIHWLIVPAPGAAMGLVHGTLYYVGAKLTYTLGGEAQTTIVTPDYIYVKPMPELRLDYFLPAEVFGDDAFTAQIETPVPFSLGVRVQNNGAGIARALKIESAQPRIVENDQGLLIGFDIQGSEVDGQPATESLLVDFGDVDPAAAGTARWIMTCTLSGEFTQFEAELAHADELGGELTSLIQGAETHFLVRDVLVDLPGRDAIRDFLANDGGSFQVYESDNSDTPVADQSAESSLVPAGSAGSQVSHTLTTPPTAGFMYVRRPDPHAGAKVLTAVIRSDGKAIKAANVWLSKTRKADPEDGWDHFVNIFDANATGLYSVVFDDADNVPQPPVLQFIADRMGVETQPLAFIVTASDPDGTIPQLSTAALPAGAHFTDHQDGSGTFDWIPAVGQAGAYDIAFSAADGDLTVWRHAVLSVCPVEDGDCDGMADAWELAHFGTLDRDGGGDFDGDGISDLDEYLNGTDPTASTHAPAAPAIVSPPVGTEITALAPDLTVANGQDPDGHSISYEFEVYVDMGLTDLVAAAGDVPETDTHTTWSLTASLDDNRRYHWRVRAVNPVAASQWVYGSFFVNTLNDSPGTFYVSTPADNSWVDSQTPLLAVTNSRDPDEDAVTYGFTLYADACLTQTVASATGIAAGTGGRTAWQVTALLDEGGRYFWTATATDEHGGATTIGPAAFEIDTANTAPAAPALAFPVSDAETALTALDLTVHNSAGTDGDVLSYYFEIDTSDTFHSPSRQVSGPVAEGFETTVWHVDGLADNTAYLWRVRANDGQAHSPWTTGTFFVNTQNEAPPQPTVKNPGHSAWVYNTEPHLAVGPVIDPDRDDLDYRFELYSGAALENPIMQIDSALHHSQVLFPLDNHRTYYWRARTQDIHGLAGQWTDAVRFFVFAQPSDIPPQITVLEPAQDIYTNGQSVAIRWQDEDPDSQAQVSLYRDNDAGGADGVLIAGAISEDPDGDQDRIDWDVSGLEGAYYIYAVIADETSTAFDYAPGRVTVDRTAPLVAADPPGGDYATPQSVVLAADEPADIFYTLDGSEPGQGSNLYESALDIEATRTLKFTARDAAGNWSAVHTQTYLIRVDTLALRVETDGGAPLPGLGVYLFTEAGAYCGASAVTDAGGTALFDMSAVAPGTYRLRADYLGGQFWSDPLPLPHTAAAVVTIAHGTVTVTAVTAAGPVPGTSVYLFNSQGAYLGRLAATDDNGRALFELPVGEFAFGTDILGSRYWSDTVGVTGSDLDVPLNAGGGRLQVTIQKTPQAPMAGIELYLFQPDGIYLNVSRTSDAAGAAQFDVPRGSFKIGFDYMGYRFWSPSTQVEDDTDLVVSVPHQSLTVVVDAVYQSQADALTGVPVYLFTPAGAYLNLSRVTDAAGQAGFDLPEQSYRVRADYLGRQFWSPDVTWQDAIVEIPLADARVTVTGSGLPLEGLPVFLFSADGTYLDRQGSTDSQGQTTFRIPAGEYKFRADHQGSQYWSAATDLSAHQQTAVEVSAGGGGFALTVQVAADEPLSGVMCYVFDAQGAYLGLSQNTSSQGRVAFELTAGSYKFRVDYRGYQFWSDVFDVSQTDAGVLSIPHEDLWVDVYGLYQSQIEPLTGVPVYLFTPAGTYLNLSEATNAAGQTGFSLPELPFRVRADYLNRQFWSPDFTWQDVAVEIPLADALVTVTGGGLPLAGIPVYLFTADGSYLNRQGSTDAGGQTTFRIPAGEYKFRADYQGSQYWSAATDLIAHQQTAVEVSAGGGGFALTVQVAADEPMAGVMCYLFDPQDVYLGMSQSTSSQGQAVFELAAGSYKFRSDYRGYQFWSDVFDVPPDDAGVLAIPHEDLWVDVYGLYQSQADPLAGVPVYLFTPAGAYLNLSRITDAAGQANFSLPEQPYRLRADYLGQQFWSPDFTWQDVDVVVAQGTAHIFVHRSGGPVAGAQVYLFGAGGAYLGRSIGTDANGLAVYLLPDRSFKFRADHDGTQVFSPVVEIAADEIFQVDIDLDE